MRDKNNNKGKPRNEEYLPVELHRISEEEFEVWDQEPCVARAD